MKRRQFIKAAVIGLPAATMLGRYGASFAQDSTLASLVAVLGEIDHTDAWGNGMAERYHTIRSGALVGAHLAQVSGTTDDGSTRHPPVVLVSGLLPSDYGLWTGNHSPMLSDFVRQDSDRLTKALAVLYDRHRAVYNDGLASQGVQADSAVATIIFSGAMVATMVGLVAVLHNEDAIPGLDTRGIDGNNITSSLEMVGMYIFPC